MLAWLFGFYYLGVAHGDWASGGGTPAVRAMESFYLATIAGRMILCTVFCAIVAAGEAGPGLLVPGLANLVGATSMWSALRKQLQSPGSP